MTFPIMFEIIFNWWGIKTSERSCPSLVFLQYFRGCPFPIRFAAINLPPLSYCIHHARLGSFIQMFPDYFKIYTSAHHSLRFKAIFSGALSLWCFISASNSLYVTQWLWPSPPSALQMSLPEATAVVFHSPIPDL